ncbi:hypothetical protein [Novosphingobium sp.]|uniref:hypothetical protein n=1 Tax=Novosphingobium sp. TaxID=1874826 RepID=UPI002FDE63A5
MKKLILAALVPATMAVAAPAMAQNWNDGPRWSGRGEAGWMTPGRDQAIRNDINRLRMQIDRAQRNRTISPREAMGLRRQAGVVQTQYRMYARDGLSRNEVRWLASRVNDVRMNLHMERADWDRDRW